MSSWCHMRTIFIGDWVIVQWHRHPLWCPVSGVQTLWEPASLMVELNWKLVFYGDSSHNLKPSIIWCLATYSRLQRWKLFCNNTRIRCHHVMSLCHLQISSGVPCLFHYFVLLSLELTCDAFVFGSSESPDRKGKITVQMKQVWRFI